MFGLRLPFSIHMISMYCSIALLPLKIPYSLRHVYVHLLYIGQLALTLKSARVVAGSQTIGLAIFGVVKSAVGQEI